MDYICWRGADGRYYAGGGHVPPVAVHDEAGCVVFEYCMFGSGWIVLCHCDCEAHILYRERSGR